MNTAHIVPRIIAGGLLSALVALGGLAAPTVAQAQPPAPVFAFWPGCPGNSKVLDNVCHTAAVAYARAVRPEGAR
jgi:hypothetical protein